MTLQSYSLLNSRRHLNRLTDVTTGLEQNNSVAKTGSQASITPLSSVSQGTKSLNTGIINPVVHRQLVLWVKGKAVKNHFHRKLTQLSDAQPEAIGRIKSLLLKYH